MQLNNLGKQFLVTLYCFLNYAINLNCQINPQFIKHLIDKNLKLEHWRYLNTSESDSIEFYKAKFHLQYDNDSLFFLSFDQSKKMFCSDSKAFNYASLIFLKRTDYTRDLWFNGILSDSIVKNKIDPEDPLFKMYLFSLDPMNVDTSLIPKNLQQSFINYQTKFKKHPLLAASLSAIVPGLGELYIGNNRTFSAKFTSLGILAAQTLESNFKFGFLHPLTFINLSFFSTFYVTNIWGAYHDTKMNKIETKNQFLIHAANHYSTSLHYSLY